MTILKLLLVSSVLFVSCVLGGDTRSRPNILWILAEDLSQDLECYGNKAVSTPHINELAAKGVQFSHVFTTAAVCAPSRTSLATGMYQTSIDAHHMRYPDELMNELPVGIIPMNELFRRGGYVTAHIHEEPGISKLDWSFARSDVTEFDLHHWSELKQQNLPFFALVNLTLTHRYFEKDEANPVDPAEVTIPPYYPDVSTVRRDLSEYYETIQHLDHLVGEVLDQLKSTGLDENTIVMFFSDHGRPFPRAKNSMYDSGTRIPLIIHIPEGMDMPYGYFKGEEDDRLLSSIDIVATSLALAGIEIPESMHGQPFYCGVPNYQRPYVISALDRIGGTFFKSRTIRTRKHRLIYNLNRDFSTNEASTAYRKEMHPIYHVLNILNKNGRLNETQNALVRKLSELELYDLESDPDETVNLIENPIYQGTQEALLVTLKNWINESGDKGMVQDSKEIVKAFLEYKEESHRIRQDKIEAMRELVLQELRNNGDL